MDLEVINKNKELVNKFPWLKPTTDDWDGTWTKLDMMPDGWREAFGEMMMEEIAQYAPKDYHIVEIKEKFGMLDWFDFNGNDQIDEIVRKYIDISQHVCFVCSRPDVPQTTRDYWIEPICKECYDKHINSTKKYEEVIGEEYLIKDEIRGNKIREWWRRKHG